MEEDYRIRYASSFFLQYGKWGHQLTPTEAMELGLIPKKNEEHQKTPQKRTRKTKNGNNPE